MISKDMAPALAAFRDSPDHFMTLSDLHPYQPQELAVLQQHFSLNRDFYLRQRRERIIGNGVVPVALDFNWAVRKAIFGGESTLRLEVIAAREQQSIRAELGKEQLRQLIVQLADALNLEEEES